MIFDAHMHVGDFPDFGVSLDQAGLTDLMAECGIDRAVVFHPDNEFAAQVVAAVPGVHGLVWANPRTPGAAEETQRYLDEHGFVGIKLHPLLDGYHPNDPGVHPLMRLAEERRVPVLVHTGHPIFTLPWSVEELAVEFPGVDVIFGHMGHGNIVYIDASIEIAARRPNVYLETSGMPMHTKIREAVERAGPDRVMYGSDAPFHHPKVEMLKVGLSGLSPEQQRDVLGANAERVYFKGRSGGSL